MGSRSQCSHPCTLPGDTGTAQPPLALGLTWHQQGLQGISAFSALRLHLQLWGLQNQCGCVGANPGGHRDALRAGGPLEPGWESWDSPIWRREGSGTPSSPFQCLKGVQERWRGTLEKGLKCQDMGMASNETMVTLGLTLERTISE